MVFLVFLLLLQQWCDSDLMPKVNRYKKLFPLSEEEEQGVHSYIHDSTSSGGRGWVGSMIPLRAWLTSEGFKLRGVKVTDGGTFCNTAKKKIERNLNLYNFLNQS